MKKIFWSIALISSLYAVYTLYQTISYASSAPQEAAGAAMALAIAAIPYIIARACSELSDD